MAVNEGIAAALTISSDILEQLKTAQERIVAMADASERLSKGFKDLTASVKEMAQGIKGTGFSLEAATDPSGAVKNIKVISEATSAIAQKASAAKKEFDFTNEIEKTRRELANLLHEKAIMQKQNTSVDLHGIAEFQQLESQIERTKNKLAGLLDARHKAFSGKPEKQAAGEFKEYIQGLTRVNDGLKQENALQKELEKTTAKVAKEQKYAADIQERATAALGMNPKSLDQMIAKLNELKAVKRQLETEGKKTGIIDPNVLRQVNTQLANTEAGIRKVHERMKETSRSASAVRSMLMTAFSPFLVQRFLGEMIKVRGEFELSQKSLAVIIQDATMAQSMFNEITQIAVRSPFSVQDILKQTKQLAAYRIETDKLIETTKMLGDISAGVGVDMNRLILAYGQVKAAEFLKGTELRQFSEAGVNMLGGLAKRFTEIYGRVVSVGEVMQMVSKRMVKFADVEAVLKEATEAGGAFYKMQEKQAETIQGRISNLNDRIQIMFNNIGRSHDKTIKGIISGLENVISHWQMLSALLEPLLGMMMIRGTMGLVGLTKVGTQIREEYALQLGLARQQGIALNAMQKSWTGITSAIRTAGNILKNNWLTILIYIVAVLADLIIKANQFRKQVNDIANDASKNVNGQVESYNRLLDIASDITRKEQDRQKALDKLKSEFGNILDIQKVELSNINEMNKARERQIELIRQQAYEEARQKAINEAMAESQKKASKRAENISRAMRNGTERGYGFDRKALDLGLQMLDESDFAAIESKVSNAILDGTINGSEAAGREAIRYALRIADRSEEEINDVLKSLSPVYLRSVGGAFSTVQRQADIIDETLSRIPGEISAKAALPYKELIKTIGDARAEFESFENNPDYESNPALKEFDYQAYLNGVVAGVKHQIESGALGEISDATRDGLMRELQLAFDDASITGGEVEQAIRRAQMKVASKYKKIGRAVVGEGLLKYEEGQSTADYIKNIDKELKDAVNVAAEWQQLQEQIRNGHTGPRPPRLIELAQMFGSKEELQTYITMLKELKAELGSTTTVTPTGGNSGNSYKSDLNTFITTLKNARKEMNKLTKEGDDKYLEKLAALGKKVGISFAEGFKGTDEEIGRIIDKYKGKLEEGDRIELELSIITDGAEHQLEAFRDLTKELWDRYENSKKLEDWGFVPDEGTTKEVMGEIIQLENYLREKGEKEGNDEMIKLYKDLMDRRLQIARTEQEAAAKIAYEANKKALDKIGQAYKTLQENVAKIQNESGLGKEEKQRSIQNQIAKSMKEIAEAQWDAYKGGREYALAFGDLAGLSDDVLSSLEQSLLFWRDAKGTALSATELQSIERALKKIRVAMNDKVVKTYFGALKDGFSKIDEAREVAKNFSVLEEAVASANRRVADAQSAMMLAEGAAKVDASERNLKRYERAQQNYNKAVKAQEVAIENLTQAQNDYDSKLDESAAKLSKIEGAYNQLGSLYGDVINLATESIEALGGEIDSVTQAGIDGLKTGISLVGNAISLGKGAVAVFAEIEKMETKFKIAKGAVLGPFLVAVLAIGAALAYLKMRDAALEKQVEAHKKNVESLEKAYENLEKAMDKALDLGDARRSYAEMNANLAKQRQELDEAIAANNRRKQTDKVREETEGLQESLDALDDKVEETRDKWLEMLGAPTDYQGVARDWADGWLSAFKETGSGLESLHENFEELYDDLVVGQLWTKIMAPQIEELQQMVNDVLADGDITDAEAAAIRAFKNTLAITNEELERKAKELGVAGGVLSGDTLQRGVETVTEKTAEALEAILNSTRYDVSDTNARLARMEVGILGEGENTIMSHLRSQTRYLADIARIASAVYFPGAHSKGAGALKVIADIT